MAEVRITGNDGDCTVAGHNLKFNTWSASFTQEVQDTSAFQDGFAEARGGLRRGTFSAGGIMSKDTSDTSPGLVSATAAPAAVVLTIAASCTATGNAVISNVAPTTTVGGDATCTLDGTFSGTITEAWDVS